MYPDKYNNRNLCCLKQLHYITYLKDELEPFNLGFVCENCDSSNKKKDEFQDKICIWILARVDNTNSGFVAHLALKRKTFNLYLKNKRNFSQLLPSYMKCQRSIVILQ